jgi:hypothetical protein
MLHCVSFVYVYDMINLLETKKSNSYDNSLIKNWVWLKTLFLKLTLTSAINPPKMSPKKKTKKQYGTFLNLVLKIFLK